MIHPISRHSFIIHSDSQAPILITPDGEQQGARPLIIECQFYFQNGRYVTIHPLGDSRHRIHFLIPGHSDNEHIQHLFSDFFNIFSVEYYLIQL